MVQEPIKSDSEGKGSMEHPVTKTPTANQTPVRKRRFLSILLLNEIQRRSRTEPIDLILIVRMLNTNGIR